MTNAGTLISPSAVLGRGSQTAKRVIDIHVHILGTGESATGCKTSREFVFSPTFAAMLISLKTAPFDIRDGRIRDIFLDAVDSSENVDQAVFLAMDGVHKNGKYVDQESHLVIPNDYVIDIARQNKRVLFGASVHPYRQAEDMLAETKRCIDEGAVLFQWAPSGQQINPEDDRCIPFYVCLAREGVPLLCHTGAEFTMRCTDLKINRYNDPRNLIKALDIGVKVIVAHCAPSFGGSVMPFDRGYFDELMEMLREAEARKWELYADISACCTPSKVGYLEKIRQEIAAGRISPKRFLYGSDFPMPSVDINVFKKPLNSGELLEHIRTQGNMLDNHYRIVKQFGLHESIFTGACDVLKL